MDGIPNIHIHTLQIWNQIHIRLFVFVCIPLIIKPKTSVKGYISIEATYYLRNHLDNIENLDPSVLNIPDIEPILRLRHLAATIWHIQTDITFFTQNRR